MSSVDLEGLSRVYGGAAAVTGLTLSVADGEFLALLGPSGCGKTTTLRMVAGFVEPSAGRIRIGGQDVTHVPPHRRNTGMVFQSYALFPHLTVAENVGFGLEMRGRNRAEIEGKVRQALDRVRLGALGGRHPRQLSGGQQQRVALARALIIEPEVLLLDEPLSNLDAKLRGEMRAEIRALQRSLGLTTILVTHDQEEAFAVADRLAVMNAGRVEQAGTPAEVFETPRNRFVADFVGVANLLPGRLAAPGVFVLAGGEPVRLAQLAVVAAASLLAIRPERITVLAAADGTWANQLPGRVREATYLGGVTEYRIGLASGAELVARQTLALEAAGTRFQAGDAVVAAWTEHAPRLVAE